MSPNLAIIGTSHISQESINKVRDAIEKGKPGIVAIELDRKRLYALVHNLQAKPKLSDIKRIGVKGFLFALIGGWLQKKLGEHVGIVPGSDMKIAFETARNSGAKIALIDRDIEITMQRFSKAFTWKEKLMMVKELLLSPFGPKIRIDLSKVPEKKLIKRLLKETREKYPGIYRVLVEERDEIMARNLAKIISENPEAKILAVVGAGHEDEILRRVKQLSQ